jgi:hypothetical protein
MNMTPTQTPANELTFQQKVALFKATANDMQARNDFAASRAEVILPLLLQQSTVRNIFKTELLPPGADARYDIPFDDIDMTWVMPQIGGVPTVQVEGAEMHVDTFGLDGGVEWQMDVARDGRFQVATLATTLLKNKFIVQEELAGWSLIKSHAAVVAANQIVTAVDQNNTGTGTKTLNIYTLNNILTTADALGIGGRRVTDIYVSPKRFGDFRTLVGQLGLPDSIKEQIWSNGELADTVANIRFHRVYNQALVDDNTAYCFTQKEGFFYGVMPIREELTTINNPLSLMEWKIGIMGRERVGFGVIDSLGLVVTSFA